MAAIHTRPGLNKSGKNVGTVFWPGRLDFPWLPNYLGEVGQHGNTPRQISPGGSARVHPRQPSEKTCERKPIM